MPLSDHEQQLLDQIERALYAEDPKFASNVRSVHRGRVRRFSLVWGGIGALLGLALVLVGLVAEIIPLSVAGFVVLVAAVSYAVHAVRTRHDAPAAPSRGGARVIPMRRRGLRSTMEQRLRRRFDERQ